MTDLNKKIDNEIAHGKKISANAEEVWGWSSPAGQLRARRRAEYFINMGKFTTDSKILEIGCGTALFTQKVYQATKAKITAIDISEDLLQQGRQKLPQVNFQLDDAMNLSFDNQMFDAVYGSSILHHLDMQKSLNEIFRVLKTGGRMVFAEPNMINPQIFVQKNVPFVKRWMGDSPDETAIVRWRFRKMMLKTGFKQIEIFPYDFLHPAVPQKLIPVVKKLGLAMEKTPLLKEIAGSVIIFGVK